MGFFERIVAFFMSVITFFFGLFGISLEKAEVDMEKFTISWYDEFEGDTLDGTKWKYLYTESGKAFLRKGGYWHKDMVTVKDGCLHISTKHFLDGYEDNGLSGWYTGAITTEGLFEQSQGYFEMRCILPKGYGIWSAFWLNCKGMSNVDGTGQDGAEIDIFESALYDKNKISTNIHIDGYGEDLKSKHVGKFRIKENNPYENFNTYGLEWNEKEYIFYINGVETGRTSFGGTSKVPEYIIASVEVGGQNGVADKSWAGPSADTNKDGVGDFIIDYVRVYEYI